MRLAALIIPALVPALLVAAPAAAQDAASLLGAWQLERETPRGTLQVPMSFVQEGDSIVAYMGAEESAVAMGALTLEGAAVAFPMDMQLLMQQMMATSGQGRRAGAAGRAGGRAGGPPRGGQGARRGGGAGGGPGDGDPPAFRGTLEGSTIIGTVTTPRGEQEFTLRRVDRR